MSRHGERRRAMRWTRCVGGSVAAGALVLGAWSTGPPGWAQDRAEPAPPRVDWLDAETGFAKAAETGRPVCLFVWADG